MKYYLFLLCSLIITLVHAQDGTLDNTFGTGGITKATLGSTNGVYINTIGDLTKIAVQKDEKIIQVGYKSSSTFDDFVIIRYLKDGALDMSFGLEGGWSATNIAGNDRAHSVAIQPDERIVVAGESVIGSKNIGAIVRYLSNGTLDASFGTGGIVKCDLFTGASGINSVAVQPDGKIIVAGFASNGTDNDFFVARYLSNGTLDAGFGTGGKTVTHFLGGDVVTDIKIHTDGRILLAGTANISTSGKFALALYTPNGLLDPSFASSGKLISGIIGEGRSAAIGPTGNIYFTGITPGQFTTLGYHMDGTPNTSFGNSGILQTGSLGSNAASRSVLIQCDGKVVVGGERSYTYVVVRYLPNGSIDVSFNGTGKIEVNTGNNNRDFGFSGLAIQEGKILMGGISFTPTTFYAGFLPTVFRLRNPSTLPLLQITNPSPVCHPATINLTAQSVTAGSEAGLTYSYWQDMLATIPLTNPTTVNAVGTYYIKGTTPTGCFSIKPVTVSFNPAISGTITPAVAAFCTPGSQLLTATGGTSYQWKKDGVDINGATAATFTATTSGNYSAIISDGTCAALTNSAIITVKPIPTGNITPALATICSGTSQLLTVTGGTSYQWSLNGNPISGATEAYYSATASGTYSAMIFNDGCAGSASNTATINASNAAVPSVSITATPTGTLTPGTSITFSAVPTNGGATPLYQWKVNGVNAGSGSSTFTTNSVINGDVVTVVLTSSLSCVTPVSATSNPISIMVVGVTPSVSIAVTPSGTICPGTTVTFTANPVNGGSSPFYQWKKNNNLIGVFGNTFVANDLSNGDVITLEMTSNAPSASTSVVTSNSITTNVTPSVTPSVSIAANPGTSICAGTTVTFTATASNEGTDPAFQWRKNGINVGTSSATYTTSTLTNGDNITVELISNASCASTAKITSNGLTINTTSIPMGTLSPGSATLCPGGSQLLTATGGSSYQWSLNGTVISGVTTSNYIATKPGTYSVVIFNDGCGASNTNTSIIASGTNPSGNISPATASICNGGAQLLTTSGGTTYQWQKDGMLIPGATNATYNATSAGVYGVTISNGSCSVPALNTSTVTVNQLPSGIISPSNASICPGGSQILSTSGGNTYQWRKDGITISGATAATYNATASGTYSVLISNETCTVAASNMSIITSSSMPIGSISPATGSICTGGSQMLSASGGTSYQWSRDGMIITGANTADYNATQAGTYTVMITNGTCSGPASNTAVITHLTTPNGIISPATANICSGGNQVLTTTGGTSYQWFKNGTAISGATANTFTATIPGNYTTTIYNGGCSGPASNESIVTIVSNPNGSIIPASADICAGTTQVLTATGGTSYQWMRNGTAIAEANQATFSSTQEGTYSVLIYNGNCFASASNTSVIRIASSPTGTISPASAIVCFGSSQKLTATGGTSYQWLYNGIPISGAGTDTLMASKNGVYKVIINSGGCSDTASNSSTITIKTPSGLITPVTASICPGGSQLLHATGGDTYQWMRDGVIITGASASSFSATVPGIYNVQIFKDGCMGSSSNSSLITSAPVPAGTIFPTLDSICKNETKMLVATGGTSYQWYFNETPISGAISSSYGASARGVYSVVVFNGACSAKATNTAVIQNRYQPTGLRHTTVYVTKNQPYPLETKRIGTTYLWTPALGLNDAAIRAPLVTTASDRLYTVRIEQSAGCPLIDTVQVKVFDKGEIYVPTGFTPNGDGKNDLLRPFAVQVVQLNYFRVFNRWGEMIYQTNSFDGGWNGTYKGKLQPNDTYVWIFEGKDTNGKVVTAKGTTTLFR